MFTDIANNMGENCLDQTIELANEAINDGIDELEDYVNVDDDEFDVDGALDKLKDAGYTLQDCILSDINLYDIGKDVGDMFSRATQRKIDPVN